MDMATLETDATARSTADTPRDAATTRVIDASITLARLFVAFKAAQGGSARNLLHVVRSSGPLRQSALAEAVHTDPSTISRHVAELVDGGLVERTPDPGDGRASLLALTPEGEAQVTAMRAGRDSYVGGALAGWSTADLEALSDGLDRFTTDLGALLRP